VRHIHPQTAITNKSEQFPAFVRRRTSFVAQYLVKVHAANMNFAPRTLDLDFGPSNIPTFHPLQSMFRPHHQLLSVKIPGPN
jgi:hypothetical protein